MTCKFIHFETIAQNVEKTRTKKKNETRSHTCQLFISLGVYFSFLFFFRPCIYVILVDEFISIGQNENNEIDSPFSWLNYFSVM